MSWIQVIDEEQAEGKLKRIYKQISGPNGQVDNVLKIHSLRPHSLQGHMALYKNVLHHTGNSLPKWYLEAIGVYVSMLNKCSYCVEHHYVGLRRGLNGDEDKAALIRTAFENEQLEEVFDEPHLSGLEYAKTLTLSVSGINESNITHLKEAGLDDGQILEINQVTSYFNYVNRTVLGLGVHINGETLGTSPNSSDSDDWTHR
ncbi:MAG: peroxidase-related enzyme [Balneolaceae bacterium]|nr:peroxidase-related enzyme [Balneolaceae bacterium]